MFIPDLNRIAKGSALLAAAFVVLQTVVVVLHEHVHSTSAWLLGYTRTPFTVVWGNPLTVSGWDEGVPYDQLFPHPGNPAESIIGGSPLLMHVIFVVTGMWLLLRLRATGHPVTFLLLYCFVAINLSELTAYLVMRPFIPTGNTGRFREGLNSSPLVLFIVGNLVLLLALYVLARKVGSRIVDVTQGSELERWLLVSAAGFLMFLWGSGLRMVALYPDPQWTVGLIGLPALGVWLIANVQGSRSTSTTLTGVSH